MEHMRTFCRQRKQYIKMYKLLMCQRDHCVWVPQRDALLIVFEQSNEGDVKTLKDPRLAIVPRTEVAAKEIMSLSQDMANVVWDEEMERELEVLTRSLDVSTVMLFRN